MDQNLDQNESDDYQDQEEELDDNMFDDPEDFVDDITDEELMDDMLAQRPEEDTSLDNIIVVDNAPIVGPDRLSKLKGVLKKIFQRFGEIVTEFYPVNENNETKGYFFMEFATHDEAVAAVNTGNGYRLDKSHIFAVYFFTDFEKYETLPTEWSPPKKEEYKEKGNLWSWLLNPDCHDQYSVIHNAGATVSVFTNTNTEPKLVMTRENWTDTYVRWSPQGTYLATFHKQGIALWGAEDFKRLGRFSHTGVSLIDFSPDERYLVTFRKALQENDSESLVIWDIKTGAKKRSFAASDATDWPIIKWSHDGKYFARLSADRLSVYETSTFYMLDKKSIVVPSIKDFSWSPTDNTIAYWVPEIGQIPAKVTLIEIPSRNEIRTKNLFLVQDCRMQWHKQGDYLCVKINRWATKSKKNLTYTFEIFRMRQALIPVDTIEMKDQPILSFGLEPYGTKFAVLHGEPPGRISFSCYELSHKGAGSSISRIKTMERKPTNQIFWCPKGKFLVLAGLKGMDGQLEFYDAESSEFILMQSSEHGMATDLEWDPTGRYVVTSVSFWSQKMDTGFIVWSFQGRQLYKNPVTLDKFCQLLWRPRPLTLLSAEDIKNIKKNSKKYHHQFDAQDRLGREKASQVIIDKRRKMMDEFSRFRHRKAQEFETAKRPTDYVEPELDEESDFEDLFILENEETEELT
ncbi:eukaryotic translation initiation factor 3 subunit B-like [Dysidea avara]|uniref:eukaryotic translation initiation factor 3 subunit B-like n=1 Tax=Dysidea avara TaxID=196820 RepID=UPI003327005A